VEQVQHAVGQVQCLLANVAIRPFSLAPSLTWQQLDRINPPLHRFNGKLRVMDDDSGRAVEASPSRAPEFDQHRELDALITFHKSWKRFSSFASFIGAALSIVSAASATVVAGLGYSAAAAVVAAFATVFTSLEKVLQFRERWDLHRLMENDFDQLRWEAASNELSNIELAHRVGEIRAKYAERMSSFRVLA
jgi:hypothetical protein